LQKSLLTDDIIDKISCSDAQSLFENHAAGEKLNHEQNAFQWLIEFSQAKIDID
jgi:hypothetical protein